MSNSSLFSNSLSDLPNFMADKIASSDREALKKSRKKTPRYMLREEKALAVTNIKARKYGLTPPDNPEAIEYEKTHCISCGSRHHDEEAYKKLDINYVGLLEKFGQQSLGMLCCACFGRVNDSDEIIEISYEEPDSRTLKEIYDPKSALLIPKCNPRIKFDIKQGDEVQREQTIDSMFRGSYNSRYSC